MGVIISLTLWSELIDVTMTVLEDEVCVTRLKGCCEGLLIRLLTRILDRYRLRQLILHTYFVMLTMKTVSNDVLEMLKLHFIDLQNSKIKHA